MKTIFFWGGEEVSYPVFSIVSEGVSSKFINCLSGLLMDDGGCGLDSLIKGYFKLLGGIKHVKHDKTAVFSWVIETWCVDLTSDQAKLYFAFDESYFETMSLDAFEKVVTAWLAFIQTEPNLNNRVELEV